MPGHRTPLVALALALSCFATAFSQDQDSDLSDSIKNRVSPNGGFELVLVRSHSAPGDEDVDGPDWYSVCLVDRNTHEVIGNVDQTIRRPGSSDYYAVWSADHERLAFVGSAKYDGDYLGIFSISGHEAHEQKLPDYWELPAVRKLALQIPGFEKIAIPGRDSSITLSGVEWRGDHTLTANIEYDLIQDNKAATINVEGRFEEGKAGWKYVITKISKGDP